MQQSSAFFLFFNLVLIGLEILFAFLCKVTSSKNNDNFIFPSLFFIFKKKISYFSYWIKRQASF